MTDGTTQDGALPREVMRDVVWSFFDGEPFSDREVFEARVAERDKDLETHGRWQPGEIAIPVPRIRVKYFGADPEDEFEYTDDETELASDDGRSFTQGELLFKLHNTVAAHLREVDHCHFEGLVLVSPPGPGEVPLYEMRQGS